MQVSDLKWEIHIMRILIVEDEVRLAEALGEIMKAQRYTTDIVYDGEAAFDNAMSGIYDCIILDVMIPKMDGFEVVRRMRAEKNTTPVIMLTAKDDTVDKIKGLDAGADDYVTKPFSMDILICKIEAIIRRYAIGQQPNLMEFDLDGVHFDAVRQTLGNKSLSSRENELLLLLCQNMGQTVERNRILMNLWGSDTYFNARSLSVYVNHLRNYVGKDGAVKILSVHGKGYKLVIMNEKNNKTEE